VSRRAIIEKNVDMEMCMRSSGSVECGVDVACGWFYMFTCRTKRDENSDVCMHCVGGWAPSSAYCLGLESVSIV
jgi:hypothetical protein